MKMARQIRFAQKLGFKDPITAMGNDRSFVSKIDWPVALLFESFHRKCDRGLASRPVRLTYDGRCASGITLPLIVHLGDLI
jgi:hypothetical protein